MVVIDGVRLGDPGIAFDIAKELAEAVLPPGSAAVPCPAIQSLESVLAIGVEDPSGIEVELIADPRTELVAIDRIGLRDAGITGV